MKRVMVFGSFDGLHDGHRAMLKEAKALGDFLIAVVAQDHIVQHLKGSLPSKNFIERFEHLQKADGVDKVVIGDAEVSIWNVVKKHKPNIIGIGHDQQSLREDLEKNMPKVRPKPKLVSLTYSETQL